MSPQKLFVLFLFVTYSSQTTYLCSDICQPSGCSGPLDTQCNSCPSNWIIGSNTCSLDTSTGYQLVAKSSDMTGGSSSISILPSTAKDSCGIYNFYGPQTCNKNLSINLASGITIAHYEIQAIFWVILYDDNTWQTTDKILITFGTNEIARVMGTFDGQVTACGGKTQTYYRIVTNFNHINSTGTSVTIDLSNDASGSGSCKWGFKQSIVLAKICHSYCTECFDSISNSCYSCISSMYLSGNTCSNTCLTGYGSVTGSNVCVLCDLKCISCSQNSTYCSSCTLSGANIAYLYNNQCVVSCPTGTLTTTNPNICVSCDEKCISCSINTTYCSSCTLTGANAAYLYNSACLTNCQTGTYTSTNPNICTDCDPKCIDCSINSTYCSSCTLTGANKAYLYNSACILSCPSGTYQTTSPNVCNTCDPKCIDCSINSTYCSSCTLTGGDKSYLYNSVCLTNCPSGTYSSDNPNICTDCDPKCISCSINSTYCPSCTLTGVNMAYLFDSTCLTNCPTGYYQATNPNVCNSCDLKCISCSINSTYCSSCTLSGANIAYLSNSECVVNCPTGTFSSTNPNICSSCDPKCISCSVNSTYCSACTLSGADIAYLYNSACLISCPTGTYETSNPNLCLSCDAKCISCTINSTYCSSCTLSGTDIGYLYNSACFSSCPAATFATTNPNICIECDVKCISCSINSTYCSSCTLTGANIAYLYNSECLTSCPTGTYPSSNPNFCNSCDLKCISCSQTADNCSSCTTSGTYESFLDYSVSTYTKCITSCTSTFFANTANHQCDPCTANCSTCQTTSSNCLSCLVGQYWLNFVCYSTCPNSYYNNVANCTPCDSKCAICDVSSTNCTVCSLTAYLLVNTCYTTCPDPYYGDNSGPNLCLSCNVACASCTGSSNTVCSSCATNYTLSGTICDSTCLVGYGNSSVTGVCIACTDYCTGCYLSATNCTSCVSSPTQYYLLTISGVSSCLISCPVGYYVNATSFSCVLCPNGCYDCISKSVCYTCKPTFFYYNKLCHKPCPIGSYPFNSTNCSSCDSQCRTCTNGPSNCTSCKTSGDYKSYLLDTVCFLICPVTYYGNNQTSQTCKKCDALCISCFGGLASNCTECAYPNLLSGTTCSSSCLTGYGTTGDLQTCVKCNNTCVVCFLISTNCSSCQTNGTYAAYLYYDSALGYTQCLMVCPTGTTKINSTRQCNSCLTNCTFCNNSVSYCLSCVSGNGLLNNTCYSPCPDGYFLNGVVCTICSPYCSICNNTNTSCSVCKISGTYKSYLLNGSCLSNCPTGYYSTQGPNICNLCNTSICVSCFGAPDNCSYCQTGFYLYNNTCLSVCPNGFAAFNNTRTCNQTSVFLSISMKFIDSLNQNIAIDLDFTYDLDQATFPKQTFQNLTFSDPSLAFDKFTIDYSWTNSHSYRILMKPNSQIFINNITLTVLTMSLPQYVHNSTNGIPFSSTVYSQSSSLSWFLIKGRDWTDLETSIMTSLSDVSNSIKSFTTLPAIQQFNKAGFLAWILPGAQLTSASLLIKSVSARNCYEGARFWGNFVYFQVPEWQKNRQQSKYVVGISADTLTQKSRLLQPNRNTLEVQSIYLRFNRTGFTTFFLFDCYMQMLLIAISWILVLIAKKLENKAKISVVSKLYSIFHSLHQITIYYLTIGLVLEVFYFDLNSGVRVVSFIICIIFNLYYLAYQLYIYYDLLKYPLLQLGSPQYREIAKKYGYFLKNIRYDEYEEDIEEWSPAHFFRPYNYHIVSFYKKYLMIFAVAVFYEYPSYAAGALVSIEIFELVRFCLSWPFASKKRNIIRLSLQITILVFFLTVFLQTLYIQQISHNNMNTISSATNDFYLVGWIGFACIFIFNISFFLIFIYDICCYFTRSNSEEMRAIRRDYYYEKILKYEKCNDLSANQQMLDSWVVKGDLNQNWTDEKENITPDIEILVEKYIINKMGQDGFTVQVEKCVQIQMRNPNSAVLKQKIKIKEQIQGTVALTKSISQNFFMIIKAIFEEYDPCFQADYLTLKTVAKIQSSKYSVQELIKLNEQSHIQILILHYPFDKKKTHKLAVPLRGFPVSPQLFNPLIYNKTLNKKLLY